MSGPDIALLCRDLKRDEGCKLTAYKDSLGVWTIGYGHTGPDVREGLVWTQAQADEQLEADALNALSDCARQAWWGIVKDDEVRSRAMVNMAFNLGISRLSKFTNTLYSLELKDWQAAAAGMRESLWARQIGLRARRLAYMIENGKEMP